MFLINSSAYIVNELQNEIGKLPPVFLPVGNKKLIYYQADYIRQHFTKDERIYVSLPASYEMNIFENNLLQQLGITPIFVRDNISLGLALVFVLNEIGIYHEPLFMLHGDALIGDLFTDIDTVAIGKSYYDYTYHSLDTTSIKAKHHVWCGYFSFSSIKLLLKCLAISQSDFPKSVLLYDQSLKLSYKNIEDWHDVGHVNAYFSTRCIVTTQRAFNSLQICDGVVTKSSTQIIKMNAEASWFKNIPNEMKRYIPQFISSGKHLDAGYYKIEYLSCLPLNELFVHGKNSVYYWSKIFELLFGYLKVSRDIFPHDESISVQVKSANIELFRDKTMSRLHDYAVQNNFDLNSQLKYNRILLPSVYDIANICVSKSLELPVINAVLHGDLCFSNILFDSRSDNIKVLDPRGTDLHGNNFIFGNQIYDLAKICHSVIGMYDFIIADCFDLSCNEEMGYFLNFNEDSRYLEIQKYFLNSEFDGLKMSEIIPPTILLFLSMLPLHYDKPHRQKAMLINALRLFATYLV